MVNYVSFSFKVAQTNYFVFNNGSPTISFDGTDIGTSSLVRMSLTVGNGSAVIFSRKAETNQSVVNSVSGGTGTTNVKAFSSYTGGNTNYALYAQANDVVTVKIWIQDPTFASESTYLGKKLAISNLMLVPAYKVTSTVSVNGTAATSSNTFSSVATVKTGNGSTSYSSFAYYKYGTTNASVTCNMVDSTNYSFSGWGTSANATSYSSTNNPYTLPTITSSRTLYAIINQKVTITAQVALGTTPQTVQTYGTVKVGTNSAGYQSSGTYYNGDVVTLTATPASNYAIIGWYKNGLSSGDFVQGSNGQTSLNVSASSSNDTYYVSYKQKSTTTIYMLDRGYDDMRIYVWGKTTGQIYSAAFGSTGGTQLSFDKARGLFSFTFTTGEEEDIGIIVSDGGSTTKRSEYTATIGNTCFIGKSGSSIVTNYSLGTKRYFYFTNNYSWSGTIYCHYWGGTGSSWPGGAMTSCYINSQNQTVYYIERSTANTGIIFNNNDYQTVDITTSTSNCRYYINGTSGTKYTVGTW